MIELTNRRTEFLVWCIDNNITLSEKQNELAEVLLDDLYRIGMAGKGAGKTYLFKCMEDFLNG